jgi:hypothetical protein
MTILDALGKDKYILTLESSPVRRLVYIDIIPTLLYYESSLKITFTAARQDGKEVVMVTLIFVLGSLRTSTNLSKVFQQFIKHRYFCLMRVLRELVEFWRSEMIGCCSEGSSLIQRKDRDLSLYLHIHTDFRVQKTYPFVQVWVFFGENEAVA